MHKKETHRNNVNTRTTLIQLELSVQHVLQRQR